MEKNTRYSASNGKMKSNANVGWNQKEDEGVVCVCVWNSLESNLMFNADSESPGTQNIHFNTVEHVSVEGGVCTIPFSAGKSSFGEQMIYKKRVFHSTFTKWPGFQHSCNERLNKWHLTSHAVSHSGWLFLFICWKHFEFEQTVESFKATFSCILSNYLLLFFLYGIFDS